MWLMLSPASLQGNKIGFSEVEKRIYQNDDCDLQACCNHRAQDTHRLFQAGIWPSTPFANWSLILPQAGQRWKHRATVGSAPGTEESQGPGHTVSPGTSAGGRRPEQEPPASLAEEFEAHLLLPMVAEWEARRGAAVAGLAGREAP